MTIQNFDVVKALQTEDKSALMVESLAFAMAA